VSKTYDDVYPTDMINIQNWDS